MRIAVCDDDALCREKVMTILNAYIEEGHRDITVTAYERGPQLLDDILRAGGYDIYILDILMPKMNGIQLGLQLRQVDSSGKILYLTSSEEYAIEAFQAQASNYILKPVRKEVLICALETAMYTIAAGKEKSLIVKTRENSIKLNYNSILYAELSRRAIAYHLLNGKTVESTAIRTTFSEAVQGLVQDTRFVLCGAATIVNLSLVTTVENDALLFKNGEKFFISRRASREVRSAWYDFWLSEENSP